MTWAAVGQSLPQAIPIAISPIPIILLILMLVSSRARTNGPMFAAGWLTGVLLVAAVSYALSDSADVAGDPTPADAISGGVTIAGVGATTSEGLLAVALFSP